VGHVDTQNSKERDNGWSLKHSELVEVEAGRRESRLELARRRSSSHNDSSSSHRKSCLSYFTLSSEDLEETIGRSVETYGPNMGEELKAECEREERIASEDQIRRWQEKALVKETSFVGYANYLSLGSVVVIFICGCLAVSDEETRTRIMGIVSLVLVCPIVLFFEVNHYAHSDLLVVPEEMEDENQEATPWLQTMNKQTCGILFKANIKLLFCPGVTQAYEKIWVRAAIYAVLAVSLLISWPTFAAGAFLFGCAVLYVWSSHKDTKESEGLSTSGEDGCLEDSDENTSNDIWLSQTVPNLRTSVTSASSHTSVSSRAAVSWYKVLPSTDKLKARGVTGRKSGSVVSTNSHLSQYWQGRGNGLDLNATF